jgi:hypothetical protein
MFNTNGGYSLADIAAATGENNGNGGWGTDGNGWWIILLFLFALGGWGNGGFGGGYRGGQGGSAADGYILASDFSNIERKIDGVNTGICDGFYAMNTGMLNGFSGVQSALCQGFNGVNMGIAGASNDIQRAINADTIANMQNTNAVTAQLNTMAAANAACCCETQRQIERGFADTNYNMATQACETRQAIATSTRDIIDSNNAGVRSILDFLTQDKIATLTAENQGLKLAASQARQNNYLIEQLKPCPVPAYVVANPNCCATPAYNFNTCLA